MPGTFVTFVPTSEETRPLPWMSWIRCGPGVGSSGVPGSSPAVTVVPAEFVAFGTPEVKSAALLSVSIIAPVRASAVELLRPGAAAVSTFAVAP
jgi:hypothetical protein